MERVTDRLLSWATDVDEGTIRQALKTSRLPILAGHVALMPDAHVGIGATVGSVVVTAGAVVPACVGVDIGCGMIAAETSLSASDLPEDLERFLPVVERAVPAGVGKGHADSTRQADRWMAANPPSRDLGDLAKTAARQFGSLGSGNHFFEVCLDEREAVWLVLHSGSRGVGNKLAEGHIRVARALAKASGLQLEDPDLAHLQEGSAEFSAYIADMLWAQGYALANRERMMEAVTAEFFRFVGAGRGVSAINCHHNFCQPETWGDQTVWVTRKGAIKASVGDRGVIPGSMGTRSYVVRGLGNPLSYDSCSHGAGRRMSRSEAKRRFTEEDLREQMAGKAWLEDRAGSLVDEIPSSYKSIDEVMEAQRDLVEVEHTLTQVLNYKGC